MVEASIGSQGSRKKLDSIADNSDLSVREGGYLPKKRTSPRPVAKVPNQKKVNNKKYKVFYQI